MYFYLRFCIALYISLICCVQCFKWVDFLSHRKEKGTSIKFSPFHLPTLRFLIFHLESFQEQQLTIWEGIHFSWTTEWNYYVWWWNQETVTFANREIACSSTLLKLVILGPSAKSFLKNSANSIELLYDLVKGVFLRT